MDNLEPHQGQNDSPSPNKENTEDKTKDYTMDNLEPHQGQNDSPSPNKENTEDKTKDRCPICHSEDCWSIRSSIGFSPYRDPLGFSPYRDPLGFSPYRDPLGFSPYRDPLGFSPYRDLLDYLWLDQSDWFQKPKEGIQEQAVKELGDIFEFVRSIKSENDFNRMLNVLKKRTAKAEVVKLKTKMFIDRRFHSMNKDREKNALDIGKDNLFKEEDTSYTSINKKDINNSKEKETSYRNMNTEGTQFGGLYEKVVDPIISYQPKDKVNIVVYPVIVSSGEPMQVTNAQRVEEVVQVSNNTDYALWQNRYYSLKNTWPAYGARLSEKIGQLADYGFYYDVRKEVLKCFQCNIEICPWDPGMIPAIEHAKRNPKCVFFRDQKQPFLIDEYHQHLSSEQESVRTSGIQASQ